MKHLCPACHKHSSKKHVCGTCGFLSPVCNQCFTAFNQKVADLLVFLDSENDLSSGFRKEINEDVKQLERQGFDSPDFHRLRDVIVSKGLIAIPRINSESDNLMKLQAGNFHIPLSSP